MYPFFFGSTYKQYHMTFVFLCLTYLTVTISRSIHGLWFLLILTSAWGLLSLWHQPSWVVWGGVSLWFWLALPWWRVMLSTFPWVCWPCVYLLWSNVSSGPWPFFLSLCGFFYNIASVLCFAPLATRQVGSWLSLIRALWPALELTLPALEGEVLTPGPPGKSPLTIF